MPQVDCNTLLSCPLEEYVLHPEWYAPFPMPRRILRPFRGHPSPLEILREGIRDQVRLKGRVIVPAAPWLLAAETTLKIRAGCGWRKATDTATGEVEQALLASGWRCSWWCYNLLIEQPEWVPPAPVPVQGRLF